MSETEIPLGLIQGRACVTRRAADAMLRVLGATQVTLRIAAPSSGDTNSQLGLTPPISEDLLIEPALVETILPSVTGAPRVKVTLSARALKSIAEAHGVENIGAWLLLAEGVLYHDKLMHVDTVIIDHFAGSEYLYHIVATE